MSDFPPWLDGVLGAAAFIGALTLIWTQGLRPMVKFGKHVEIIIALPEKLEEAKAALEVVAAKVDRIDKIIDRELRPNGGYSMNDRLKRVDEKQQADSPEP